MNKNSLTVTLSQAKDPFRRRLSRLQLAENRVSYADILKISMFLGALREWLDTIGLIIFSEAFLKLAGNRRGHG